MIGKKTLNAFVLDKSLQGFDHLDLGIPFLINFFFFSMFFFIYIHWRREWQSTPVFLPGEFHGQRSLVGYSSWSCKELDTTE